MDTLAIFTAIHVGKETPSYHSKLMEIAKFETLYGKNQREAKSKIDNSFYGVLKTQVPTTSLQYIEFLDVLASNYANQDIYDSATVCQQKVVDGYLFLYGQNNIHYAGALTKLANYQLYHGNYPLAISNLTTVGILAPQIKSDAVELMADLYIQMASLEAVLGDIAKSRSHISKALQYASKETRPSFTTNMENAYQKTISLYSTGNYFQAEKELIHDLNRGETTLNKTHPYLNRFYAAHAQLLVENSNYAAAEKALNDALASSQKGTIEQANVLLIQSEYYLSIFDYKSALNAIKMADDIFTSKLGKSHLVRSEALIKLADVSAKAKKLNFNEIDKIYNQTTDIIKNAVGISHPLYAINLERQAEFYIENNKLNEAEKLLISAKAFWTGLGGENNSSVADILIQLGKIYYLRENYNEAEKYYGKGKSIYSSLFNSNHPGYIRAQSSLARVYYMKGNLKESIDAMAEIVPIYLDYTKKHFPSLSFRQKSKFWNSFKDDFDFYTFLALEKFDRTLPFLRGDVYNMVISTKALLLSSDIKLRKTIASSNDSILIAQFNEWLEKKEVLTQALALSREDQLSEG
ncbi:MAG: tetratricopeptide repeat protein, partial [Cytophagales bacterium]|nr:tetratricopeptide repeat protein [Cytophagales bacterium]